VGRSRYYRLADGTMLPSVTTILGVALNKPALPGWAAKVVAEEAMAELPRLVRMSRTERGQAVKWLKGSPYKQRDEAGAAGTKVHKLIEAHTLGKPFQVPDADSPVGQTLGQFVRWMDEYKPEFEATEAVVASYAGEYAGTLDAICRIPAMDNRLCVIDWKTSKTGPWPEWALQIAAYARAEVLWLPDGTSVDMPTIEGAAVLRLRPDFFALHEVTADLEELIDIFNAARGLAVWAMDAQNNSPFGEETEA